MKVQHLVQQARSWFRYFQFHEPMELKGVPGLLEMVEQARQEWKNAQTYYNAVSDTDLVDHAVYLLQASERKYMYLLKQARLQGIVHDPFLQEEGAKILKH